MSPAETGGYTKPAKLDFPIFFGENPRLWLDRCRTYFDMYRVPILQWVSTATLYMDGHAALCLHVYKRQHVLLGLDSFCQAVNEEFGSNEYDAQMNKLLQLKQACLVAEYQIAFEASMYHLLSLDATLNNRFFITQFLLGLQDGIRGVVRLQAPSSVTRATVLSRIQEEESETSQPRHRVANLARTTVNLPATVPPPIITTVHDEAKRQGNGEF